ncbi:MAG TPA: C4-dicarboxylate ABC transporter [Candidatus Saccharicenans sp.]|jgi:CitMHS family citrate-Mg2+:H+ or citrate-Ca2+:H+ symporter|nr:C4-dicarboxylate ABC transporter [Candidatus Saccharicenans sp.]HOJ26169.1 C4-dicarboxylate ABC transporter [Candidatus Saccharicenans sp.]HOL44962.1 C4-dicarboxylate ABC transporter [Candidatus Saccharicenans sp.]HOM93616.1 C4-dicarboxylate ABC transporter [Candidatus Saccharicenans sp.]HOP61369.1 C4-dicarboxylate ABC transporter [Candidatus Saccharicenans sp.]
MIYQTIVISAVLVVAYALAQWRKLSIEMSLFLATLAGAVAGAIFRTPPLAEIPRHLVEGSFTYLDVILVFFTATLFITIIQESGGINFAVRQTVVGFARYRFLALFLLMIIVLIPGALTGAGSVSLLVVGTPVALALKGLGVEENKIPAILFILAGLAAAAPPVNIWAMILCAGTAIPYVGFELPLGIPVLLLGTATILILGRQKGKKAELDEFLNKIELVPGMNWWRLLLPFAVFFGLVIAYRLWPFSFPILGLPLEFIIASLAAYLISPVKINLIKVASSTVSKLLPLLSIMVIVGMLQQIMAASGVKGLISYSVLIIPLGLLFCLLPIIIPFSEGILTYGGAAIIGIPLVWYLNSLGYHATIVISALSLLWPLGDGLPPTALIGRLSLIVTGYEGSYWSSIKKAWLPWVMITAVAILMVIFSSKLSFLVIG